jgi:hypothetical protein
VDLVSLVDFVLSLPFYCSDSCNAVADPFHVAVIFALGLNNGLNFAFGIEDTHNGLDGGFLSANDFLFINLEDFFDVSCG